jgi:hypothetical protein
MVLDTGQRKKFIFFGFHGGGRNRCHRLLGNMMNCVSNGTFRVLAIQSNRLKSMDLKVILALGQLEFSKPLRNRGERINNHGGLLSGYLPANPATDDGVGEEFFDVRTL